MITEGKLPAGELRDQTPAREWVMREFAMDDSRIPPAAVAEFIAKGDAKIAKIELELGKYEAAADRVAQHPQITVEQWVDPGRDASYSHTNNMQRRFENRLAAQEKLPKGEIPQDAYEWEFYYLHKKGLLLRLFEEVGFENIKGLCESIKKYEDSITRLLGDIRAHAREQRYELQGTNWQSIAYKDARILTPEHLRKMDELDEIRTQTENFCRRVHIALGRMGIHPWFMES